MVELVNPLGARLHIGDLFIRPCSDPAFRAIILERQHPRSDDMTPCIPEYLRLLIADPFALMPPRDPNDDDDDEDEDEEDDEDDEDDNDKTPFQ